MNAKNKRIPKTNWYKGTQKPVRKGVYKRLWKNEDGTRETVFSFWNGWFWGGSHENDLGSVLNARNCESFYQNLAWCGLSRDPDEVAQ